ncbi:MAG: hypothetical protein AB2993_04655 [Candidatus Symbiodolus clandestinus]
MSDKDFPKEEELLMVNPQAQPLSSKRKIGKPNNICQQQYLKTRSVRIYLYALKNRVQINNTQSDIPGVNE